MKRGVNVRSLQYSEGTEAEELVHRIFHSKGRLELRHGRNLFDYYNFLSCHGLEGVNFWGAFSEDRRMIGLTGFVNYELKLTFSGMKCFYNSDSLVIPEEAGQSVYLELLNKQIEFYNSREFIPVSWGIEHNPGKLEGMKVYLEKRGEMEVRFLGHTRGSSVFTAQPLVADAVKFKKIFLREMNQAQRQDYLANLETFRAASLFFPRTDLSLFEKILKIDPEAYVVSIPGVAGVIAVNLESIRQYSFRETGDSLRSQHWSMFWGNDLPNLFWGAYSAARESGFDVAIARDLPFAVVKLFPEATLEPRRVFAVNRRRDAKYFLDLEKRIVNTDLDALFV